MDDIAHGLTLSVRATVALTAEEWQLYTLSMNCDIVAKELNDAASKALSCGDPQEAYRIFERAQKVWFDYGASDQGATGVFENLHRAVFG